MPKRQRQFLQKPKQPAKPIQLAKKQKPFDWQLLEKKGQEAIAHGKAPKLEPEIDAQGIKQNYNEAGWCSAYATRTARIIFGLNYARANAWLLANNNSVVQSILRKAQSGKQEIPFASFPQDPKKRLLFNISQFDHVLRPGRILGVYYPWSSSNEQARTEGKPYTHAMLYLGKDKRGKHIVLHNIGGPRLESLELALSSNKGNGLIVESLQPKIKK